MKGLALVTVLLVWAGQVEPEPDQKAQSAARLKLMKETAARFEIAVEPFAVDPNLFPAESIESKWAPQ